MEVGGRYGGIAAGLIDSSRGGVGCVVGLTRVVYTVYSGGLLCVRLVLCKQLYFSKIFKM